MPMVNEHAFGSADFGASLRGVYMHLKALADLLRLQDDSRSLHDEVILCLLYWRSAYDKYRVDADGL